MEKKVLPHVPKKAKSENEEQESRNKVIFRFLEILKRNREAKLESEKTWEEIKKMEQRYVFLSPLRGQVVSCLDKEDLWKPKSEGSTVSTGEPDSKKRKKEESETKEASREPDGAGRK